MGDVASNSRDSSDSLSEMELVGDYASSLKAGKEEDVVSPMVFLCLAKLHQWLPGGLRLGNPAGKFLRAP